MFSKRVHVLRCRGFWGFTSARVWVAHPKPSLWMPATLPANPSHEGPGGGGGLRQAKFGVPRCTASQHYSPKWDLWGSGRMSRSFSKHFCNREGIGDRCTMGGRQGRVVCTVHTWHATHCALHTLCTVPTQPSCCTRRVLLSRDILAAFLLYGTRLLLLPLRRWHSEGGRPPCTVSKDGPPERHSYHNSSARCIVRSP